MTDRHCESVQKIRKDIERSYEDDVPVILLQALVQTFALRQVRIYSN